MPCVNADGSLTPIAQRVLESLLTPGTVSQICERSGIPLYRVRGSLRELTALGTIQETGELFEITPHGREILSG